MKYDRHRKRRARRSRVFKPTVVAFMFGTKVTKEYPKPTGKTWSTTIDFFPFDTKPLSDGSKVQVGELEYTVVGARGVQ